MSLQSFWAYGKKSTEYLAKTLLTLPQSADHRQNSDEPCHLLMLVLSKEHAYCTLGVLRRQGCLPDVLPEGGAVSHKGCIQSDMTACPKTWQTACTLDLCVIKNTT